MTENSAKSSASDLNLTNNLSHLPKNLNLEQKMKFVVDSINSSLDTYLKHFTDEIVKETKKIMLSQKQQDQVCVDLTNDDDNLVTRKQQSKFEEKRAPYEQNILRRVISSKREQLNEDFKNQMKKVKQFVNENVNNTTNSYGILPASSSSSVDMNGPISLENYINFDEFFMKVKKILDKFDQFFSVRNPSFKSLNLFDDHMLENVYHTNDRHKYTDFSSDTESTFIIESKQIDEKQRDRILSKINMVFNSAKSDNDKNQPMEVDEDNTPSIKNNSKSMLRNCYSSDDICLIEPPLSRVIKNGDRKEESTAEESEDSANSQNEDGDDEGFFKF
jgi:hypothetical protein